MDDSRIPPVAVNDVEAAPSALPTPCPSLPAKGEDKADALPLDAEIAVLLGFRAVHRKVKRPDGWNPARQREFIHRLALCGHPATAATQMGKNVSGIEAIYRSKGADSFRAAWDAALALAWARGAKSEGTAFEGRAPGINVLGASRRRGGGSSFEEDDDAESAYRRVMELRDVNRRRLLFCRRLYLQEICDNPGKRAAFEILTQLPIDWKKAEELEPQDDEPWRVPNMRTPEMLLTVESGWHGGMTHGPDKMEELRQALNEHLIAEGKEPIDWDAEEG